MPKLDTSAVVERANADPAFRLCARYWNARIAFDVGEDRYVLHVVDGEVEDLALDGGRTQRCDARVHGDEDAWDRLLEPVPPPSYDHIGIGNAYGALGIEGDLVTAVGPYFPAIQELVRVLREVHSGPAEASVVPDADRAFDTAVGRYVYVRVQGVQYRIYFEEAGTGDIPMVLQHTAGADGRQWRHVLEDPDYQRLFRMIAFDLPYHGRSLPPTGVRWWETEYRLTRAFLVDTVVAVSHALGLDRPVFMGCSIGGHLAPDLALYRPGEFRAVVGINAGLATGGAGAPAIVDSWYHPRVSNEWKAAVMYGNTAPTSPEPYRRETTWIYSQGAPGVLKGDVFYYSQDHDLTAEQAQQIDTTKTGVYLLTGEYDFLAGETGTAELARNIRGAHFELVRGAGHFGPFENPEGFKPALLSVMHDIVRTRGTAGTGPGPGAR